MSLSEEGSFIDAMYSAKPSKGFHLFDVGQVRKRHLKQVGYDGPHVACRFQSRTLCCAVPMRLPIYFVFQLFEERSCPSHRAQNLGKRFSRSRCPWHRTDFRIFSPIPAYGGVCLPVLERKPAKERNHRGISQTDRIFDSLESPYGIAGDPFELQTYTNPMRPGCPIDWLNHVDQVWLHGRLAPHRVHVVE